MSASLVGSEMCIRDRFPRIPTTKNFSRVSAATFAEGQAHLHIPAVAIIVPSQQEHDRSQHPVVLPCIQVVPQSSPPASPLVPPITTTSAFVFMPTAPTVRPRRFRKPGHAPLRQNPLGWPAMPLRLHTWQSRFCACCYRRHASKDWYGSDPF
eukprot:7618217-Alexandrium_andersonii.AAC.1